MHSLQSHRRSPLQDYRHNVDRFLDAVSEDKKELATHYAIEAKLPTKQIFEGQVFDSGEQSETLYQSFSGYQVFLPDDDIPRLEITRNLIHLNDVQRKVIAIVDQNYYLIYQALEADINAEEKKSKKPRGFGYILQPGVPVEEVRRSAAHMILRRATHLRAVYHSIVYDLAIRSDINVEEAQKTKRELMGELMKAKNRGNRLREK